MPSHCPFETQMFEYMSLFVCWIFSTKKGCKITSYDGQPGNFLLQSLAFTFSRGLSDPLPCLVFSRSVNMKTLWKATWTIIMGNSQKYSILFSRNTISHVYQFMLGKLNFLKVGCLNDVIYKSTTIHPATKTSRQAHRLQPSRASKIYYKIWHKYFLF